jgi:hypothetical protein
MQLELNENERAYLIEEFRNAHARLLHELNHTDTSDYKAMLKEKIDLVEALQKRVDELRA